MDALRQPKAYSYKRFSTPAQEQGDSLRRQTAMAQAWADRMGVQLDTELNLTDRGVSAYTGANKDVGNLGAFLRAVEDGTVPAGSWLLVENLDRLSREPAFDASYTMQGIIRQGVTVVDLSDGQGREYNMETLRSSEGLMHLMAMLLSFARGNQESAQKGRRVGEAYAQKRAVFASEAKLTKPYTRRLPAWITWDAEAQGYALIEDRAELLRWMFEVFDDGVGVNTIAAQLNTAGTDTWGAGKWKASRWHSSYVRKILTNKAAIGVFVPHRVVRAEGGRGKQRIPQEPIAHRFPAAVDRDLFERVNARMGVTAARGKNAAAPVRSIFAGLTKCEHCGGTVTRISKGQYVYLVCAAAHARAGTCKIESIPYLQAVSELRRVMRGVLENAPRGNDTADTNEQIEDLRDEILARENVVEELLDAVVTDRSAAARQRLRSAERELEERRETLRALVERRDAMTSTNVKRRLEVIEKAFAVDEGVALDVPEANKALRGALRRIILRPRKGSMDFHWHHADRPQSAPFYTKRFFEANEILGETEQDG